MTVLLLLNLAFLSWVIFKITRMEIRLMSQIDDLRQGEADLKTAIGAAADRFASKLDALQEKLDNLPVSAPVAEDLTNDIQALKDDVALLNGIAPADPAPGTATVAVGDTIGIPSDPADPNSPTVDHTVTDIGADGTITATPAGDPPAGDQKPAPEDEQQTTPEQQNA